ncbi:phospholipase A [Coralloluteibacterium stylophorae]|uniref:Phospholipase A1 n=1 Tax=Coralloluteibacterium stylophorae TaxID=1776034 RepID=A0A8J7VV83_9GAMM|nr:phospholipase A [Coralloluteibacterium stylophorae]MBS7455675.1 phospholipase A [Coralloluteibacterium stylophorae]
MPRLTPIAGALLLVATPAFSQQPVTDPETPEACTAVESDAERLACYDQALGRPDPRVQDGTSRVAPPIDRSTIFAVRPRQEVEAAAKGSRLDSRWELEPESKLGIFNFRAYKPVYVLPVFWTSDTNPAPSSPNPNNTITEPQSLDATEAKFQISFKTKAWQGVFGDVGDLWLGYTQSSRWQVYNNEESRPFRETNYEPEAILAFRTNYNLFGWHGQMLGISLNHQSNGRSDPYSRSWNRAILQAGFERGDWTITPRVWARISETDDESDNNPDIVDYVGQGDLQIVRQIGEQELALMLRHSLRGGDDSRGAVQLEWTYPIAGSLHGYLQVFHGYGESLIDYNHKATYIGAGVSLLEWY